MKNKKNIITGLLAVILAALLVWWFTLPQGTAVVSIPQGASAHIIADALKSQGLISSKLLFLSLLKITGWDKELKHGTYVISRNIGLMGLLSMLKDGRSRFYRVTVPEGFTSRQIADLLAQDKVIDRDKFIKLVDEQKVEGYLFPETYFFDPGVSEQQIIDMMVKQFERVYTEEFKNRARELKMSDKDVVILASIIEEEAKVPEERPIISGVFHNRLKKRIPLESCATVLFALGKHKEQLLYKDLKVQSPYNTYIHFGLTPGPISNPGVPSLKAALYPEQTQYRYFVVTETGSHLFSTTLEEHAKNKRFVKSQKKLAAAKQVILKL